VSTFNKEFDDDDDNDIFAAVTNLKLCRLFLHQ